MKLFCLKTVHIFLLYLGFSNFLIAQETATISGYISDRISGERLAGATVFITENNIGTLSNDFGYYSLKIPKGEIKIIYRFVGYEKVESLINLEEDTVLNIQLSTNNFIDEIKVKAVTKEDFILSPSMSMHRLTAREVEKIPVVLGEADLLKAIQLLPGVSFANEGETGLSVRGGSPDQTLIQLDGVPVYNVNHLWGFMSAFNNDAINESKLYKGGLPARFGGRLSSVLDIKMKEGNLKEKKGTFTLSPIAGRYTLEGPISRNKASFMISARKTWADVLLAAVQKLNGPGSPFLTYGFWDLNAKTNWIINPNNRIYLSFYTGRDAYIMEDGGNKHTGFIKFSYNWQNLTAVLRWNRIFSPALCANFSVYNSRFKQEYFNEFDKNGNDFNKGYNNLNDISAKGDFDWFPVSNAKIKFGYNLSVQKFSPEVISYRYDSISFQLNKDIFTNNFISEVYTEGDIKISKKIHANLGLRAGNLATQGENYFSLQPRASFRYLISDNLSGKLSYSRMKQYLHQLQNTTLGIPTEMWVSSTKKIKPGTSNLFSGGLFWQSHSGYDCSAEVYYSDFNDVLQYKEGTQTIKEQGDSWEDFVTAGEGESYGLEWMAQKKSGKLRGWVAYTLSKSTRRFAEINFGKPFPYAYDRRHQINVNANYLISERVRKGKTVKKDFSVNFNYASGKYITFAVQEYQGLQLPGMESLHQRAEWFNRRSLLNSVNNYQMPDFHHLNLSYRIEKQSVEKTIVWNFSVYNIYNRLNPWYYYKKENKIKQISLFPIIPSVSFTYKW